MQPKTARTTRQKVIDSATELTLEHGFTAVSLKDIEKHSGVSNGSIFHHFGSKDGILRELFVAERRAYLGAVGEAILGYDGDPVRAFGEGARAALRYHTDYRQRYQRLIVEFNISDWMHDNAELWIELAGDLQQPVVDWAVPHFAAARLPLLAPSLFQALTLGPAEAVTRQWLAGRLVGRPIDYGDLVANFVAAGLRAQLVRTPDPVAADR